MQVDCGPIHQKGRCDGCGGPLPSGRRAWCSNECERRTCTNHDWQRARYATLERDGHRCVICRADDQSVKGKQWRRTHGRSYLEINHITPVNGNRRSWHCQNHLDNLETLCHDCHVAVTGQQRDKGLIHGKRRHLWKVGTLFGQKFLSCAKCGTVDTTIKLGLLVKVGATVHYGRRFNENCTGPLMKDLRRARQRR